jgi:Domain of unknown function (DUF397)
MEFSRVTWRKASYSGSNNNCVEVAGVAGLVGQRAVCLVRDSKDREGSRLLFSRGAWDLFVATVQETNRGQR